MNVSFHATVPGHEGDRTGEIRSSLPEVPQHTAPSSGAPHLRGDASPWCHCPPHGPVGTAQPSPTRRRADWSHLSSGLGLQGPTLPGRQKPWGHKDHDSQTQPKLASRFHLESPVARLWGHERTHHSGHHTSLTPPDTTVTPHQPPPLRCPTPQASPSTHPCTWHMTPERA